MIADHHSRNLETLQLAFVNGDVGLLEAQRVSDGQTVVLLVAFAEVDGEIGMTPFAEMVNGNPYELYRPPNPDGGFHPSDQEITI